MRMMASCEVNSPSTLCITALEPPRPGASSERAPHSAKPRLRGGSGWKRGAKQSFPRYLTSPGPRVPRVRDEQHWPGSAQRPLSGASHHLDQLGPCRRAPPATSGLHRSGLFLKRGAKANHRYSQTARGPQMCPAEVGQPGYSSVERPRAKAFHRSLVAEFRTTKKCTRSVLYGIILSQKVV